MISFNNLLPSFIIPLLILIYIVNNNYGILYYTVVYYIYVYLYYHFFFYLLLSLFAFTMSLSLGSTALRIGQTTIGLTATHPHAAKAGSAVNILMVYTVKNLKLKEPEYTWIGCIAFCYVLASTRCQFL